MTIISSKVRMGRASGIRIFLFAAMLVFSGALRAQIIDRVDVTRSGPEAEIQIRFTTVVQYLRNFPASEGEFLRINLQVTGTGDLSSGRVLLESRTPPTGGLVPAFTVSWPEEGNSLGLRFAQPIRFRVRPGADGRSISVYVPLPESLAPTPAPPAAPQAPPAAPPAEKLAAPPEGAPAQAAPTTPEEVDRLAHDLLERGRRALQANDPQTATEVLNRLLNLPPNTYSQEAQEIVGVARERNGEFAKARAEYELYLKLYPEGEGALRVRQRLQALPAPGSTPGAGLRVPGRPEKSETQVSGGFSQYYYHGSTKFDSTLVAPTPGLKLDQASLTTTDQNSLISNLDLTARMRGPDQDSKLVLRDIYTSNFLPGQKDINRLYSLFYERQNADASVLTRIGRQPGFTGGLQGSFDGAWAGFTARPGLRVNGVVGKPVEFFPVQSKTFAGINADIGPFKDRWNANVFFIEQHADGQLDRRAVGGEFRYFDARRNMFGLFDYDLAFKTLNIAMVQGNLIGADGSNVTALFDHRRVPVLQLTNALPGQSATVPNVASPTIRQLLDAGTNVQDLRDGAKALTPISNMAMIGYTKPVTPTLQLGGDVRVSNVSGTEGSGNLPAAPGTGNLYVYEAQAIKSSMLTKTDSGVANFSLIEGATLKGQSLTFNYVLVQNLWRMDAALRLYRQRSDLDVVLFRVSPSLRLAYRFRNHVNFEVEVGTEESTNTGPTQSDKTSRKYFSLGYRWDFL